MPVEGAAIVVSGGKELKQTKNFSKLIKDLARVFRCSLGGTRPARDAEWITTDNLIGSSGKTVHQSKIVHKHRASGAAHYTCGL